MASDYWIELKPVKEKGEFPSSSIVFRILREDRDNVLLASCVTTITSLAWPSSSSAEAKPRLLPATL